MNVQQLHLKTISKSTQSASYVALFFNMDYKKVYNQLIEYAKQNPLAKYKEQHHIVPKAEGGSDDKSNLIKLTARQHYIAHLLLAKIYDDVKMHRAVLMMQSISKCHKRNFKFNSRLYDAIRNKYSEKISGENHWNYGKPAWNKGIQLSYEQKEKIRKALTGHHLQESTKEKLRNKTHTDEWKAKMSEKMSGKNNPFYGKSHTPETMKRIKTKLTGRQRSKDACEKASISMHKLKWWNNGKVNVRKQECPNGFVHGRLKK